MAAVSYTHLRSILTNSQLCEVLENGSKDGEHEFSLEDQKLSLIHI